MCVDGQKVAKRLSVQIAKETKKVTHLLQQYNDCTIVHPTGNVSVSLQDVLNPQDAFWHSCSITTCKANPAVPHSVKQELIRSHLLIKRSSEELDMIKEEMGSTVKYLTQKMLDLKNATQEIKDGEPSKYTAGAIAILQKLFLQSKLKLEQTLPFFKGIVPVPLESEILIDSSCHSSAISDSESDSDISEHDDDDYDM